MGEFIRIGAEEGACWPGATVDLAGAWITQFGFGETDVLYPRFVNEEGKLRGGMHICSPGFGSSVEPQHGPARNALWTPVKSRIPVMNSRPGTAEMGVVLEWMPGVDTSCEGLKHTLELAIMDRRSLRAQLTIKNEDGERIQRIAPGFHPYFNIDSQTTPPQVATIYRPTQSGEACTVVKNDIEAELRTEDRSFKEKLILGSNSTYVESNLMTVVTWSDDLSKYVCYEPTQAGPSLEVEDGAILLRRGDEKSFFISIRTAALENRGARLS